MTEASKRSNRFIPESWFWRSSRFAADTVTRGKADKRHTRTFTILMWPVVSFARGVRANTELNESRPH